MIITFPLHYFFFFIFFPPPFLVSLFLSGGLRPLQSLSLQLWSQVLTAEPRLLLLGSKELPDFREAPRGEIGVI